LTLLNIIVVLEEEIIPSNINKKTFVWTKMAENLGVVCHTFIFTLNHILVWHMESIEVWN